jgi:hypothetical protein
VPVARQAAGKVGGDSDRHVDVSETSAKTDADPALLLERHGVGAVAVVDHQSRMRCGSWRATAASEPSRKQSPTFSWSMSLNDAASTSPAPLTKSVCVVGGGVLRLVPLKTLTGRR